MYSNTVTTAVAGAGGGKKRVGLVDKLQSRHQAALSAFRDNIVEVNRGIDAEQVAGLAKLKSDLASSHAESESILAEERQRVEAHEVFLDRYNEQFTEIHDDDNSADDRRDCVADGDVLPVFQDVFHDPATLLTVTTAINLPAAAVARAQESMKTERLRLLGSAVLLRHLYEARAAAVKARQQFMEETEVRRRETIQDSLRELMLTLAKISYCSVTASHALAQRVLHGANEQIALNFAATQTLLSQLGQREVLKHRGYAQEMASLLFRSRACMERSSLCWARTLLQSAVFRRPTDRMAGIERVSAVSARARKDAANFLTSLSAVVTTLRSTNDDGIVLASRHADDAHSQGAEDSSFTEPPLVECGGVGAAGWLRLYSADPQSDPFPRGCDAVVDEWRMKVAVVLGNVQANCQAVIDEVKESEAVRQRAVAAVHSALQSELQWIRAPLDEESPLLAAASLLTPSASGEALPDVIDDVFRPFSEAGPSAAAAAAAEADQALQSVSSAVTSECAWFVSTVENGLLESYKAFEQLLAIAFTSVLRWFEKSTNELVETARGVINPVRTFYVRRCETRNDVADKLARMEGSYKDLCERLAKACSLAAAETLFTEGLQQLDVIAAVYTSRQQHVIADLRVALSTVTESTAACYSRLMDKLGLESVADTQSRLELSRQEKLEQALAEMMREQQLELQQQQGPGSSVSVAGQSSSKRRGNKKDASPLAASATANSPPDADAAALMREQQALALAQLEEEIPLEEMNYSQITAVDGTVYNVVGPLAIVDEEAVLRLAEASAATPVPHPPLLANDSAPNPTRSSRRSFHAQPPQRAAAPGKDLPVSKAKGAAGALVAVVPQAFVSTYTPMIQDTILEPQENFLPRCEVDAWKALLREELLNWFTALRYSVEDGMKAYCEAARAEVEQGTNELLRRHRRRPAALQADLFETRVRELENEESTSEKYTQRFRERLAKLSTTWDNFIHDPQLAEKEANHLAEMEKVEAQANSAGTLSALQSQDRRHAAQCASYADGFVQSCQGLLDSIANAKTSLEEECRRYLADRAQTLANEELGDGVTLEQAIADDPTSSLVRNVLAELAVVDARVRDEAQTAMKERRDIVESARARYATVFARNTAELQLIVKVQEAFSWLKTQQHAFQMTSTASEVTLAEAVSELEKELTAAIPRPAFAESVHQLLQSKDAGVESAEAKPVTAQSAPKSSFSREIVDDLISVMNGELQQAQVAKSRKIRSCSLAAVFSSLSRLREILYVRGATLDALTHSVEMVHLVPESFIEPQTVLKEADGTSAAAAAAGGSSARGSGAGTVSSRRGRSTSSGSQGTSAAAGGKAVSMQAQLLPLPQVVSASAQFAQWAAQTKEAVERLVDAHLARYPAPVQRNLPGADLVNTSPPSSPADSKAAARAAADAFCRVQEERLMAHVAQCKTVYYQQVHRVHDAVSAVPRFAAASLHALAVTAAKDRLGCVLAAYGTLANHSLAFKQANHRVVKLSLGTKANVGALSKLMAAEDSRQVVTKDGILTFWGLALREVQDENDQHTARCYTAINTFFNLLRGLVAPENLVAFEWEDSTGRHRGLKHLMKMRARQGAKAADEQEDSSCRIGSAGSGRRERRLQETLPLPKQDGAGGKGSGANTNNNALTAAPALPPASHVHPVTTFQGMPLLRLKSLEEFNNAHQAQSTAPLNTVYSYFPGLAEAEAAASGAGVAAPPVTQQSARKPSKRRSQDGATLYGAEGTQPVTPAIQAASTQLHRDTVGAVRDTAEVLNHEAVEVVADVNDTFQTWESREDSWRTTWQVMMGQLQATGNASQLAVTSVKTATQERQSAR